MKVEDLTMETMGINELMEKLNSDREFAQNYKDLRDFPSFAEQAGKDGYTVTEEALTAKLKEYQAGELSDEDLENVAGGKKASFAWSIVGSIGSIMTAFGGGGCATMDGIKNCKGF